MQRFRIYTENCQDQRYDQQLAAISSLFDGFTLTYGTGYWQGKAEKSLTIEIIAHRSFTGDVYALAKTIKEIGKQDSILVTSEVIKAKFI